MDRFPARRLSGRLAAVAAVGTAVLVTLSVASYAQTGNPHPMNVFVTNTAAAPVPVAGTVNVTGSVDVGNHPASQRVHGAVTPVRGEPFQLTDRIVIGFDRHHESSEEYSVPAGKDLVVTFVTVQAGNFSRITGAAGEPERVTLTTAEGPGIQVFLPLQRQGSTDFWSASLPTEVTFASRLFLSAQRHGNADRVMQFDYTIAGYLVDEPAS